MTSARTVLVTGGAGGIGRAVATAFHTLGDNVVLADVDGAEDAAAALGVRGVAVDITDEESITRALDETGPVDVLVNNAGLLSVHGRLLELPAADMLRILHTNVHGTFLMTQQVARRMVERGAGGVVVNLSSIGGRQPTPGMGGYESSKAAVDALTRWAAIELAEHGIRVNAVAPGPVLTPMLAAGMPEGSPAREAWVGRIPLRKLAAVEDVAAAVVFLAGDTAAHITGTSLPVDGGQLLG
ncbi:NAD(P)-dependent dehydrogenase (short-subunit alcohol dehydrogenase family) [Saccharothrix tamanrassetensis]|uniref:NAD(P)-dependent dehydrogenase (Short-subunit alcohol dehydrogenase family) n=1 Tax=Saccharothrix tamanrassetensis TaxID=1051531 RepID=A0A841CND8_9PSEU|nr:SDR family NAD(P)-dependent oxidoreductase [Saccharothrix tamanrassetensis]MBB5958660.1 NAD(P)-dependent dehydrogenase (short-subunit alcohol dehydrogenase family) [Saccharothrix tamanrassetensis]